MQKFAFIFILITKNILCMNSLDIEDLVRRQIANKANLDASIVHFANPANGQKLLHRTCLQDETVGLTYELLKAGANPNVDDGSAGQTPLHYACLHGSIQNVQALLENNANPNSAGGSFKKTTPLLEICTRGHGFRIEKTKIIVALLLKHGANLFMGDSKGRTMFEYETSYSLSFLALYADANIYKKMIPFAKHIVFCKPAYLHLLTRNTSTLNILPKDIIRLIIDTMFPAYQWQKENYEQLVARLQQKK